MYIKIKWAHRSINLYHLYWSLTHRKRETHSYWMNIIWMYNYLPFMWIEDTIGTKPMRKGITIVRWVQKISLWNKQCLGLNSNFSRHSSPTARLFKPLGPLHTQDWEPVTMIFQALSLVENAELVQVRFTLPLRTNEVCEYKMDVKSTWIPKGHQMDNVSWSLGLPSKTTSWR